MDNSYRIRKHEDSSRSERHGSSREHYRDDRRDRDGHRGGDRRRSRSPHGGHRSSRHEQDSYSSSRHHRANEREERYYGRDQRGGGDRQWDRDRVAQRRDARRDDDRRGGGRGRDQADRGGGERRDHGGEKADRDEIAMQARKRSRTPPPKKREPTPDLTDVVAVTQRKRRLTQWDIKPPGYENVTAEQAKLSGMFPLPGAPRAQAVDPSKLQTLTQLSGATAASTAALKPTNARQSKRLFVHNIPPNTPDSELVEFFNLQLNGLNVVEGNDPCLSCQFSNTRDYAMLEFKNPSEATMALALDGISMHSGDGMNGNEGGSGLIIRRPKDYIIAAISSDEQQESNGEVSTAVADSQNKISVCNILPALDDEQVKELLSAFGKLKSFVLVKDKSTEESRGIAFCEYVDLEVTDVAVQGLNGMDVGNQALKVQRASIGVSQSAGIEMGVNAMSLLAGSTSSDLAESRVLQLLNMVTAEDLINDEDYQDIVDDIKEECSKYGEVLDVKIPRPSMGSRQSSGVGKIFVKFANNAAANTALASLAGRKFDNRTVVTTYFSEELFEVNAW